MNNIDTLNNISKVTLFIILISVIVFCVSILPLLYGLSTGSLLIGTAGVVPNPDAPNPQNTELSIVNAFLVSVSGILGTLGVIINGLVALRKVKVEARTEEVKLKTTELQYQMQMNEIEKLKLELKQEENEKKKKKR